MGAGLAAHSVYAAQGPGFQAAQGMTAQSAGIQAGAQQLQAQNELQVAGYNAGLAALTGHLTRENQAEQYNASGVLLEGSPLAQLEQTRQLAAAQVNQIQSQGLLQGDLYNTQANQTINQARALLLGNQNAFDTGQANADIASQNVLDQDIGIGAQGAAQAINIGSAVVKALSP